MVRLHLGVARSLRCKAVESGHVIMNRNLSIIFHDPIEE